ncbi:ABC transporter ATP-binding protein [Helicovermis profundi]|uniref:ABC transporter ATP-binding protein n=1 Tax=Helicovermis profundi TaxID=3065157 RepID=A0AAU9EIT4_9FIRM|nr:ABC transporter ATP-binding protein [Clostridia bacterium S502]
MSNKSSNTKKSKNTWKNIFKFLSPFYKNFIFLMLLMSSMAFIEAKFPLMTRRLIDDYIETKDLSNINMYILGYSVLIFLSTIVTKLFFMVSGRLEVETSYLFRHKGFEKLQKLSFSYYDKTALGWIMSRITSDVNRISETISWGLLDLFWGAFMMIIITFNMFRINVKLSLLTLSVVPLLVISSLYFQRKMIKTSRNVRKINSQITAAYSEGINGAITSKTLVLEEYNLNAFKILTRNMKNKSINSAMLSAIYLPIVLTLSSLGMAFALYYGGYSVSKNIISIGTIVLFINYSVLFFEPVREIARVFAELQVATASAERILELINEPLEIKDTKNIIDIYGDNFNPKKENWEKIKGDIEFENVSFYYNKEESILENFNLKIKSGQKIALVGETGSGKSTIVNLACRFYEPTKGKVLIDDVDYKKRSQLWLHSNIGYVLQTPHLFSGTIRENIRYGNLNASEDEMINAAKLANAYNFIQKLEKKWDTEVGEGGNLLSTGEKQLISFARAIIANPKIFILDEATSSIDAETEEIIQNAIQKILKGRTSFIVAHRLSTIKNADRILVLKKGKVIEDGTHTELMDYKGHYYNLYTNQFIEEKRSIVLSS